MEYYEKRSIVSLVTLLIVYATVYYDLSVYLQGGGSLEELHFWGKLFFENVVCLIVVRAIALLLFDSIQKRKNGQSKPKLKDERDRLIAYKTATYAYYTLTLGILLSMLFAFYATSVAPIFIGILTALMLSAAVVDVARVVLYRKGA